MTPTASAAHEWLLSILRGLVLDPTAVTVQVVDANGGLEFIIIVPPKMLGRIIGRGGSTIGLVRQLAYVYAQTQHLSKITITVAEPERESTPHATDTTIR